MADKVVAIDNTPVLDLRGLRCPKPALRTKKHLAAMFSGDQISVVCTDELSVIDIPHLINTTGDELLSHQKGDGEFTFVIRKR